MSPHTHSLPMLEPTAPEAPDCKLPVGDRTTLANQIDRSLLLATARLQQTAEARNVIVEMMRDGSSVLASHGVIECGLLLYDPHRRLLRFEAMFHNGLETDLRGTPLEGPFPVDEEPLSLPWGRIQREHWLWGLTCDTSILVPSARDFHEAKGAQSVAYLPLRRGADCLGFIGFSLRTADPATADQVDLLQSVGSQIALALEVRRLAQAAEKEATARAREAYATQVNKANAALQAVALERERTAEQRAVELARSNDALQSTIDLLTTMESLDEFVPSVLKLISATFKSPGCAFYEHFAGEPIHLRYWLWNDELLGPNELNAIPEGSKFGFLGALAAGFELPAAYGGLDVRKRRKPRVEDARRHCAAMPVDRFCVAEEAPLQLNVPLVAGGATDGALIIRRSATLPFTGAEIELADNLGKQLALAMRSHHLAAQAHHAAVLRMREHIVAQEREKVSREIHDTLAQGYAAILVQVQATRMMMPVAAETPLAASLQVFERLARDNLAQARHTMAELRADPYERTMLDSILAKCAESESVPGRFSVALQASGHPLSIPRFVEVEVRRIVTEALRNARQHARVNSAEIRRIATEGICSISVIDRGVGFDVGAASDSFGIRGMRERASRAGAELSFLTAPGCGTEVTLILGREGWTDVKTA